MTLPIASEDDLKAIVANALPEGSPNEGGPFYQDLFYEFHAAVDGHMAAAHKLISQESEEIDHESVEHFVAALEAHGNRLIDALLPRYEIAVRAHPDRKNALRDDWVGTLSDYVEAAALEYDGLDWMDRGQFLRTMVQLAEMRLTLRIDHVIRGLVIEPKSKPKWFERHPVAYAVGLLVIGALLGGLVDAGVTLVTGG